MILSPSPSLASDAALAAATMIARQAMADEAMQPVVTGFFDTATGTVSYVARDAASPACAIIDSVLEYDPVTGRTDVTAADPIIELVRAQSLAVAWQIETHIHADHLSAAPYLLAALGGKLAVGRGIIEAQRALSELFNTGPDLACDGRPFEHLFDDGEAFSIGGLKGVALHTPGHTSACTSFVIGDAVFVGDVLMAPDRGTGRCDFPGGDAATLHRSIRRLFGLPEAVRVFTAHDYPSPDRQAVAWESTIGAQRRDNIMAGDGVEAADFIVRRQARDASLAPPRLMSQAVKVNLRGGYPPEPEANDVSTRSPLNHL